MMDKTPCKHCSHVGYVRETKVLQGRHIYVELYCGLCNRTWTDNERRTEPRAELPKPRTVVLGVDR